MAFNIDLLTQFLGWCTIINIGLLAFTSLLLFTCKNFVLSVHSKVSGLSEDALNNIYFKYLANFKLLIIVFNIAPYIALKILS